MNLYQILELSESCTNEDIKKSYRRLALLYHPDKNNTPDSDKFIQVTNAYQILINPQQRKRYDLLNNTEKIEIYSLIKSYLITAFPKLDEYIKLFFDDEQTLKSLNFSKIFDKIWTKMETDSFNKNLDINGIIQITYDEKYTDKMRIINVTRKTKDTGIFYIPLRKMKHIIHGEGEYDLLTERHGDIILTIEIVDDTFSDFSLVGDDVYYNYQITLYEYLYGGNLSLRYFNGETITTDFDGFVGKFPLISIEGRGMPIDGEDDEMRRGNFYIVLLINNIEEHREHIKILCDSHIMKNNEEI